MNNYIDYTLSSAIELQTSTGNIQINGLSNINCELSMHFLIYRIDNINNGKHYIGQHHTINPIDTYMGSGTFLTYAIQKEGLSAFVKTILFDFDNFNSMDQKEMELVQLSNCYPYDQLSYNLKPGGKQSLLTDEIILKILATRNANYDMWLSAVRAAKKLEWQNKTNEERIQHIERMRKSGLLDNKGENNPMYGRKLKDCMTDEEYNAWLISNAESHRRVAQRPEWHKKMSEITSGENNPMYGKNWKDFSTPEKIKLHKIHLSQATSGENNPMYGKSSWEKCTPEQRADRIKKFKQSIAGKNKGRKFMQLPGTYELKFVKSEEIQQYLNQGYVFSSVNKRKIVYNMKNI